VPTLQGYIDANAPYVDKALLVLLTIEHPSLLSTLHLVSNNEDVISNGDTYTHFPFVVDLPTSTDESRSTKLSVSAIGVPAQAQTGTPFLLLEGNVILANANIVPGSFSVVALSVVEMTDNGSGVLVGPKVDSGSGIDYATGVLSWGATPNLFLPLASYDYYASSQSIVSALRGIPPEDGPLEITIQLVFSDDLDTIQLSWPTLEWTNITYSLTEASGELSGIAFINAALQQKSRRFTPTNNPGMFGIPGIPEAGP